MSEHWRSLFEHLPWVCATAPGGRVQINLRDIVGAILVGAISTIGGATLTTARLEERFAAQSREVGEVSKQLRDLTRDMQDLRERLARNEVRAEMTAADRRPR